MSNHKNPLPHWLNESYMQEVLKKSLDAPNLTVVSMDASPGSTVGDNYCCQIWRIQMNISKKGEKCALSVIAKVTPETQLLDIIKQKFDVFDIEASVFDSLLPKLKKFNEKYVTDFSPLCYHVDFEHKVIIMEDLKEVNFQMQPRGKFLNKAQCGLVMDVLATFHGLSFSAIQEDSSLPNNYQATFWDGNMNDMNKSFLFNSQKALEKNVKHYSLSNELSMKLLKFWEQVTYGGLKVAMKKADGLNFLLHGDCWMNNMMFHSKEGVYDAVKLLDFQIVYHGSFANDLHYFIFSSADVNVILSDLDWMLERYYTRLKMVAPAIPNLTLERIKQEFEERFFFGYMFVVGFRPFIVAEEPPDLDSIMAGNIQDMGFSHPQYVRDLQKLLPFFDSVGVF